MDYLYDNWGDLVSLVGLLATVVGLWIAIRQVMMARKAAEASENAASAAQRASIEARDAIHNVLTISDLQRVIGYVQQIKSLHRDQKWEICLHLYQLLRASLADIQARLPDPAARYRMILREAVPQIIVMENSVDAALGGSDDPEGVEDFNSILNGIQARLEEIVSSAQVGESEVSIR